MRPTNRTLLELLSISVVTIGTTACHSSKNTVRVNDDVPVAYVDYDKMKSNAGSRSYEIPQIGALIAEAIKWLGVPYKYAGNDRNGVDCSGLTSQVFLKTLNIKMPRNSREQQRWCAIVKKEELLPGDLVFFATGSDRNRVSHVGIYIGDGEIIHASSSRGVIVSNLGEKYYVKRYHSSGRPGIIQQLYASAAKNSKKDKGQSIDSKVNEIVPIVPSDTNVPSISVEQLIEMQVDSIASGLEDKPTHNATLPTATQNPSSASTPESKRNSATPNLSVPVVNEEPVDTIFTQFFD